MRDFSFIFGVPSAVRVLSSKLDILILVFEGLLNFDHCGVVLRNRALPNLEQAMGSQTLVNFTAILQQRIFTFKLRERGLGSQVFSQGVRELYGLLGLSP